MNEETTSEKPSPEADSGRVLRVVRSVVSWAAKKSGCYLVDKKIKDDIDARFHECMENWTESLHGGNEYKRGYQEGQIDELLRSELVMLDNLR